jgi:hypothetical protein
MGAISPSKKWLSVALLILAVVFGVFVWRGLFHPEFGRIRTAEMIECRTDWQTHWQTRSEGAEAKVRSWLHVSKRPQPPRYLSIGSVSLEWSLGGHIYMEAPDTSTPFWEFALSDRKRLADVTRADLNCEFYGRDDPRGTNVFGKAWAGRTIRVPDGQIFFARPVTNRSTIYIIRLGKHRVFIDSVSGHTGRMRVEYLEVTNEPSN